MSTTIREELKKIDAALMAIHALREEEAYENTPVRRANLEAVKEAAALLPRDVEHEDFVDMLSILLEAIDEL
jgi:hypothetical protein